MKIQCNRCGHEFESPVQKAGNVHFTKCKNVFKVDYRLKVPCPQCKHVLGLEQKIPNKETIVGVALEVDSEQTQVFIDPEQAKEKYKKYAQKIKSNQNNSLVGNRPPKEEKALLDIRVKTKRKTRIDSMQELTYEDNVKTQMKAFRPISSQMESELGSFEIRGLKKNRVPQFYISNKAKQAILVGTLTLLTIITSITALMTKKGVEEETLHISTKEQAISDFQKSLDMQDEVLSAQGGPVQFSTKEMEHNHKTLEIDVESSIALLHIPELRSLTSSYGLRLDPFTKRLAFHGGLDFRGRRGDPVEAALEGKVSFVGRNGNYGKMVIIKHKNGYETRYAHLDKIYVDKGAKVEKGHKVGAIGSTGRSTGPHLHFELRKNGKKLDPLQADVKL
ncbi:MAG: M23 family metallopeptidase [Bdellovibrionales bacterium]|nr:M23 family metallopeptidase [Bdellovibrionales bacterium]